MCVCEQAMRGVRNEPPSSRAVGSEYKKSHGWTAKFPNAHLVMAG